MEAVLEYFNFGYIISNKDKANIPSSGRVVIIANHPLGALDALALISLVKEVRSDVKVLANDVLMHIEPLQELLIPIDNLNGSTAKESIKTIYEALQRDEALIVFPSGEVSRAHPTGINAEIEYIVLWNDKLDQQKQQKNYVEVLAKVFMSKKIETLEV